MNYPNVALRIENYLPTIELHSAEDKHTTIARADKALDTLLMNTAKALGTNWSKEEMWTNLAEGDESVVIFPAVEFESDNLDFKNIENTLKDVITDKPVYAGMSPELTAEIDKNWYSDVLASVLHEAYNVLIARTVFMASELGVGDMRLLDDRMDARLVEKMTRDLAEINIPLL